MGHLRKPSAGRIRGKIKLSISYKVDTLHVLVHHIENLSCAESASVIFSGIARFKLIISIEGGT